MSFKLASAKPRSSGSSDQYLRYPIGRGMWKRSQFLGRKHPADIVSCKAICIRGRIFSGLLTVSNKTDLEFRFGYGYRVVKKKAGAPDAIRTCDFAFGGQAPRLGDSHFPP